MKKYITTAIAFCITAASFAQQTTGKAVYMETVKFGAALQDIKIEGDAAKFADLLPKEQSFSRELYFTSAASLYKPMQKDASDNTYKEGGATIRINMDVPEEKIYRGMEEKKLVQQKEFMGRKFLVTSEIKKADWKMTGKQKTVLGYPCQQATTMHDSEQVVAWFTPAIPVSTGPSEAGGLPGLILAMEVGKIYTVEAVSVELKEFDKKLLAKPTEGKKMTEAQFEAMMKEKRKEMEGEGGGNGNVIIRVQNL
jgi:GLPGLI family protein